MPSSPAAPSKPPSPHAPIAKLKSCASPWKVLLTKTGAKVTSGLQSKLVANTVESAPRRFRAPAISFMSESRRLRSIALSADAPSDRRGRIQSATLIKGNIRRGIEREARDGADARHQYAGDGGSKERDRLNCVELSARPRPI